MTLTFDLDARARLAALESAVERFRADYLNEDLAGDCALKAWHLCDHVFQALKASLPFAELKDFQNHVKDACPELAHLQVLCYAHKHGDFLRNTGEIEDTYDHLGDFDPNDFCPADFDTPRLEIVLTDGKRVSFNDVLDPAVAFWSQFFDDHEIE